MSAALVRDFFPGLESFVGRTLWTFFFPPLVEERCPRPYLSLQVLRGRTFTLMWPVTSICCLLGVVLGFSYGASLLCQASTSKARKGTFTWGCAFIWYGMMSTGGLFYHCMYQMRVFYLLDVVSTACTCVSILAVYWVFLNSDDRNTKFRSSMIVAYGILACLALFGGDTTRNLLYLGPASLAFLVGVYFVVKVSKRANGGPPLAWLVCASMSAFIALATIPLDRWLCSTLGANFSMIFWFFLGCDLAMVYLYHFAVAVSKADTTTRQAKFKPW